MKKNVLKEEILRIKQMMNKVINEDFSQDEPKMENDKWVTPEDVSNDRGFYSDMYKEEYGSRPHDMSSEQLADWLNDNFKLDGKHIVKKYSDDATDNTDRSRTQDYPDHHGSPYDRGSADSYYGRERDPHYYPDGSYEGERVTDLSDFELAAYNAGYDDNERSGDKKDWGE